MFDLQRTIVMASPCNRPYVEMRAEIQKIQELMEAGDKSKAYRVYEKIMEEMGWFGVPDYSILDKDILETIDDVYQEVFNKKTAMTMARLLSSPVLPFAPYFL